MNMILICSDLQKLHLIPFRNFKADFLEHSINLLLKYSTPVFRGKNQVVEQDCNIVAFVDILAHRSTILHAASGRGIDPERLNQKWT